MHKIDHMVLQYKYIISAHGTLQILNQKSIDEHTKISKPNFKWKIKFSCCHCGRKCQRNAVLSNSWVANRLQTVSILSWQRGMVEIICLNVFIYTPKGFISHCERCNQRLPAPIIIHLNLPGTELVITSLPPQSSGKLAVSTLLSTYEACLIPVIQMYPQGTGRGSVTATL